MQEANKQQKRSETKTWTNERDDNDAHESENRNCNEFDGMLNSSIFSILIFFPGKGKLQSEREANTKIGMRLQ